MNGLSLFADPAEESRPSSALEALLTATIPGRPVGAARPRVVRLPTKADGTPGRTITHMPDNSVRWEEQARQSFTGLWGERPPWPGLVIVELLAVHHRPGRLRRRADPRAAIPAGCKPDLDNVVKLAMDAMVKAGVLVDDTRVAELRCRRLFGRIDLEGNDLEVERVEVRVIPVP